MLCVSGNEIEGDGSAEGVGPETAEILLFIEGDGILGLVRLDLDLLVSVQEEGLVMGDEIYGLVVDADLDAECFGGIYAQLGEIDEELAAADGSKVVGMEEIISEADV